MRELVAIATLLLASAAYNPAFSQSQDAIVGQTCSGPFTTTDRNIYGGVNFSFKKVGSELVAVVRSDQGQNARQNHGSPDLLTYRGDIAVKVSGNVLEIPVPRPESPGNYTIWQVTFDPAAMTLGGTNNRRATLVDVKCRK